MQLKQFYNIATKVSSRKKCHYLWWYIWLVIKQAIWRPTVAASLPILSGIHVSKISSARAASTVKDGTQQEEFVKSNTTGDWYSLRARVTNCAIGYVTVVAITGTTIFPCF